MALLHYSTSLTLNLWEASERQRNGEPHVLGSSITVTRRAYDEIFKKLSEDKEVTKALRRITPKRIACALQETFGDEILSSVHLTRGIIRITPCVHSVTEHDVTVGLPVFLEGLTSSQAEAVLKKCLNGLGSHCRGNELIFTVELTRLIRVDFV